MLARFSILMILCAGGSACSSKSGGPCDDGSRVSVGCVAGNDPILLGTSELPPTTSHQLSKNIASLHVAVDETDVYFTTLDGDVMRASKSGGAPVRVAGGFASPNDGETCLVSALAVNAKHLYWSTNCGVLSNCESGGVLECVSRSWVHDVVKSSADMPNVVFSIAGHIDALATDGEDLYASTYAAGTTSLRELTRHTGTLEDWPGNFAGKIAVGERTIFWGGRTMPNAMSGVFAVAKDASPSPSGTRPLPTPLISTSDLVLSMASTEGSLYWIEQSTAAGEVTWQIERRRLESGDTSSETILTGESTPRTFAVDPSGLYGTGGSQYSQLVRFAPKDLSRQVIAIVGAEMTEIATDGTHVYWIDSENKCTKSAANQCDAHGNCSGSACLESTLISKVWKIAKP